MRSLVAILSLMLISATAFSADLTCKLSIMVASKRGYIVPLEKEILVSDSTQTAACSGTSGPIINGSLIGICAHETEYVGTYEVQAMTGQGRNTIASRAILLTSKKDRKMLDVLNSESILSDALIEKLEAAGIEAPSAFTGDSLMVDDALEAATKKGLVKEGDTILATIESCSLK